MEAGVDGFGQQLQQQKWRQMMGWILAIGAAALLIWFIWILARHAMTRPTREQSFDQPDGSFIWGPAGQVETVDSIEAAAVEEQQRTGRELWRRVKVSNEN